MFFYCVSCRTLRSSEFLLKIFLRYPVVFGAILEADKFSVHSQELCFVLSIKNSLKWIPNHF